VERDVFDVIDEIDAHIADGEFDEAEALWEEGREEFGDDPELVLLGAEIPFERDDWERCLERVEAGREADLDEEVEATLLALRGYSLFYLDRDDEARRAFDEAVGRDGESWWALLGRATVHEHLGYLQAALLDLDRALHLDDQEPEPFALRGRVHIQLGNHQEAERDLRYAVEIDPYDDESRLNLARLNALSDEAATATEMLEPLVEEGGEPEFVVPAALLRSQMSLSLGSTDVAIEDAETAIDVLSEDPWGYLQKAAALLSASRPGDAIAVLEEADSHIPADEAVPDLHALRASAYEQMGKREKAAEHRQKGQGAARLPEIVYGPELNPARDVPVDPNQPISVDALLDEIFGDPEEAPEGYREEVRDLLGRIPEIAEENPGAKQVEIELPPLEPGGESPGQLVVDI